jgi:hypothetical protein
MAFTLILLRTRSAACSTWTDGVYSDPPAGQISCLFYLDRWRLLWSSCGPDQLLVLPGQMAFTLILLWTRSPACPTWTEDVYSDPPMDQISCLTYLDRWRLLWFSCGPSQPFLLPEEMRYLASCPTWTDGVYSDPPVDQVSCQAFGHPQYSSFGHSIGKPIPNNGKYILKITAWILYTNHW